MEHTTSYLRNRGGRAAAIVAVAASSIVYVATVLEIHARNPRTLVSLHGMLHSAIVQRFGSLTFPPENPFYAGRPVCYYWFFHFIAALAARAGVADPLHAMEWVIALSLVVLSGAAVVLGRRTYGSAAVGVLIGLLALCGGNLLAPLIWIAHYLMHGPEAFAASASAPFGAFIYGGQLGARLYGPNLPYFFNVTSRPVTLALLVPFALALRGVMRRRSVSSALALAGAFGLVTAMSPLVGVTVAAALLAAWGLRWLLSLRSSMRAALPIAEAAALVLGFVAALPTFYHMFGASEAGTRFVLFSAAGAKLVAATLVGAAPLAILARLGLRRADAAERPFLNVLQLAAYALLAMAAAIQLPVENSCNMFHAAIVLLAVPAAGCAHASPGNLRTGIALLLFAAAIPNGVLSAQAYTGRAPIPLAFEGARMVRLPADSDLAALYAWIARETPADAVLVADGGDARHIRAIQGNAPELPAMTGRVMYVGAAGYMTDPYPDAARRRAIRTALLAGRPLSDADAASLAELGRPIFVVTYEADRADVMGRLTGSLGTAQMRRGSVAAFRWPGTATGKPTT